MKYIITTILCLLFTQVLAQDKFIFSTKDGAIRGYDPVAYFTSKQPVKGEKSIKFSWKGANWHFATEENKELFAQNPEKYAPQYGGYCAYAVAKGSTASTDPEAWTVVEGKLYLNYSKSIRKKWRANQKELISKADKNWPGVLK